MVRGQHAVRQGGACVRAHTFGAPRHHPCHVTLLVAGAAAPPAQSRVITRLMGAELVALPYASLSWATAAPMPAQLVAVTLMVFAVAVVAAYADSSAAASSVLRRRRGGAAGPAAMAPVARHGCGARWSRVGGGAGPHVCELPTPATGRCGGESASDAARPAATQRHQTLSNVPRLACAACDLRKRCPRGAARVTHG